MPTTLRTVCSSVVVCVLAALALAQDPSVPPIVANQNRVPAGKLEHGVLNVQLEIRSGAWRPEADDGPQLFVQAFGEEGHAAQIPGPLLRMPAGTTVYVKVTNKVDAKATVYGLNSRPGDPRAGIVIDAGKSVEWSFAAGAPGTYYYWARTTEPFKIGTLTIEQPVLVDAQLNGAFIVDPPGVVAPDRVFVLNLMFGLADILHDDFEVVSINGKSYPFTEPLEYTEGKTIRWRVINPSFGEHPMHLHGAFYKLLSIGDSESNTTYPEGELQSVVTEDLDPAHTMMLEWTPSHVGRWLFHCHFHAHISTDERIPVLSRTAPLIYGASNGSSESGNPAHDHHEMMSGMNDMAGLVLAINVKASSAPVPIPAPGVPPHKADLVIEPTSAGGKLPTFTCSVREGKKIVASEDKSMGPPIIVTRGEPTEITVSNHLRTPTTIHWHGIELDSYYDGVIGGGTANQMTTAIAPGTSFVARFTPSRAGTFIYHTHAQDPDQLTGGVYGALIVLEPGEQFDREHDRLLVVGTRDNFFDAKRLTINGAEQPLPMMLKHGETYRLRIINMAPNLGADFQLGSKEHATWRAVAKDGAALPQRLVKTSDASLHIASGETYDFEFRPQAPGDIPMQFENSFSKGKVTSKFIVQ
jgi:FtsP/CotA-like multicopper oxidase with cupredoxin domain